MLIKGYTCVYVVTLTDNNAEVFLRETKCAAAATV